MAGAKYASSVIDHRGDQRESWCLVLACLLMSWLGCGGGGLPPPPAVDLPPEPRLKYGVHVSDRHFPDRPWLEDWLATVAKDKEIGAQVSRVVGLWNQIESTQGNFNWGFDLNVDKAQKPCRCQRITVWGRTTWSASRHPAQSWESHSQKRRSRRPNLRSFRAAAKQDELLPQR